MNTLHDVLVGPVSLALLLANVVVYAAFLAFYATREPWRRSWFGWTIVVLLAAILQLSVRAVLTELLGENYPGRDLVLVLGRLSLFVAGVALFVGLLYLRRRKP